MDGHHTSHKTLNLGRLFLGLLLVFVGLVYFARAAGFLPSMVGVHWTQLWPLVLIFLGLSLVKVRGSSGMIAGIVLTILVLGVAGYAIFRGNYQPHHWMMFGDREDIRRELPWLENIPCDSSGRDSFDAWNGGPLF